jgi:hypothetical protein
VAPGTCENVDCTVQTTGICLLSNPEPVRCPHFKSDSDLQHFKSDSDLQPTPVTAEDIEAAIEQAPAEDERKASRTFHSGSELGLLDASEISRARYAHVIGVLGCHDAGKTCFLSSLYLLASGSALPEGYLFKRSETLQAFEDRARGLREWEDGKLKEQLVDHTILADTRQPSLLHLAIREDDGERRSFDLLLTDLPGEWTDKLVIRKTFSEAFRFLHRADGIILVVDGNLLLSDARHVELQKFRHFVERLVNDVKVDTKMPFVILVSKADQIGMQMPSAAEELREYVAAFGFPVIVNLAAAFSRTPETVKSGTGVFDAIKTILFHPVTNSYALPAEEGSGPATRSFLRSRE